jgi:hypothetical protein
MKKLDNELGDAYSTFIVTNIHMSNRLQPLTQAVLQIKEDILVADSYQDQSFRSYADKKSIPVPALANLR